MLMGMDKVNGTAPFEVFFSLLIMIGHEGSGGANTAYDGMFGALAVLQSCSSVVQLLIFTIAV